MKPRRPPDTPAPAARRHRDLWLLAALGTLACLCAQAQIRTDGSLGPAAQSLAGPGYLIPQSLGKVAGNNLFHSFQSFHLATGESASFSTTTPTLANVISRVTGGEVSRINGTLRLSAAAGAPAFFFINPAGVTFGAGASVDVPGALHVSTANYLKFSDGNFFADTASVSTLSSADPAAFGFLGATRASILVKDAVLTNAAGGIALVAGDVEINHAGLWTGHGDIRVVAGGGDASEVSRSEGLLAASGRLEMTHGSGVITEAQTLSAGGQISIAAGEATLQGGSLIGTFTATAQPAGSIAVKLASLEIDGGAASGSTGITSQAAIGDVGAGGDVTVAVQGAVRILGGGLITSDTYGGGTAGNVAIKAESLLLDGAGHPNTARITNRGSNGNAGVLAVDVVDSISLVNASRVSSDSFGSGQAGAISLHAGKDIHILTDSAVASDAYASGNAGTIALTAQNLTVDGTGGQLLTQVSSQALVDSRGHAGSIHMTVPGALTLIHGGKIITDTYSSGNAGDIQVTAGTLLLDGRDHDGATGIFSTADFFSTGNSGTLNIDVAGDAQILHSAKISSNTWSMGNGGSVAFKAGNLLIDGMGNLAGAAINAEATAFSSGHGGSVTVNVPGHLQIGGLGFISATTSASGNAGAVTVSTGRLTIDGLTFGLAGIESASLTGGAGNAGPVSVSVTGDAQLLRRGYIRSDTRTAGLAGDITVLVNGDLTVDDGGQITSATSGTGHGGNVGIHVGGTLNVGGNGLIRSDTQGIGDAGRIDINAAQVVLARGAIEGFAWIRSDSVGSGAAGSVHVSAQKSIKLAEGSFITSDAYSSGHAGSVSVSAPDIRIGGGVLREGAAISSDTYASGHAGRVEVTAQTVTIEGGQSNFPTGITSRSISESSGNAGTVVVNAHDAVRVLGGGVVTSSTRGAGRGGEVQVNAASIEVSGTDSQIGAVATRLSSGQPGNVSVRSQGLLQLRDGGSLSIENDGNITLQTTQPSSRLNVQAVNVVLDGGSIKASSTGNVAAGSLQINVSDRLSLKQSGITTSANTGNGGVIGIRSGRLIDLNHAQITTSVSGSSGNGGDIQISAGALVLNSGFIQANTAARNASGGLVAIDTQTLVASGNTLLLGGLAAFAFTPDLFGFNVIQAAAPTGISGAIEITSPVLDLSGSLGRLSAAVMEAPALGRNPCDVNAGSSLALAGRGGMPVSYRGLLRAESVAGPTATALATQPSGATPVRLARAAQGCP